MYLTALRCAAANGMARPKGSPKEQARAWREFGEVIEVGRAFGVLRLKGLDVDFSLPRRDSKRGPGHRGFDVEVQPGLNFESAARRRDLRVNSIGLDILSGHILDPFDGRADLEAKVLRATDPTHFSEDPLRALRVAQFTARLEMVPDAELIALCAELDLSEVSPERVLEEFRKLLLKGRRPSLGLKFLRQAGLLHFFPELAALIDVPQDPLWHPEGDVWVHTLMVLDEAALLRDGGEHDLALMFGALCHDLGKPLTTVDHGARVRSPAHDHQGLVPTASFLERMRAPVDLVNQVQTLVKHHLAPALFIANEASDKGYRRLARRLAEADVPVELLVRVAMADHFGRSTPDALARNFPAAGQFLARTRALSIDKRPPADAVQGRHLIARGLRPGPEFGPLLAACRDIQDQTGWTDPERILTRALRNTAGSSES